MNVVVLDPPKPIVSLQQAKRHLRVEDDGEDAYIADLVEVATAHIDGPQGWLGLALGEQILEATLCAPDWSASRRVPIGPLREILSETPSVDGRSVAVRYRAGHPVSGEGAALTSAVPAPIRHAILLMVGDLYANRESSGSIQSHEVAMPTTVKRLLMHYRIPLFA
ncbi:MAG: head-tail connector protein [Methylorubrum rhodinum]|uniref:head-tail connector protein n=1 Tax=Methylorubrum rhodinum TaxID=29428 RepID=UPI003BAFD795